MAGLDYIFKRKRKKKVLLDGIQCSLPVFIEVICFYRGDKTFMSTISEFSAGPEY